MDPRGYSVTFESSAQAIDRALWDATFPHPLEGHFWYRALEASELSDQFAFSYAVVSRDGRQVAIAPCFVHNVPITLVAPPTVAAVLMGLSKFMPSVGYQRTLFVGSPCSDEGTIGVLPGEDEACIIGVLAAAMEARSRVVGARMIVFKDIPGQALPHFRAAPGFVPTVSYPGTSVRLTGSSKETYLRSLSHNQRHNLLKKLKRSSALLPLETTVITQPSDAQLTEILGLFMQTYERGKTKFERLSMPFFKAISLEQPSSFILLRDARDGSLVAFMLVFCLGHRVINKFIGLDYARDSKAYLYFRLFDAAVDFACSRGATELQSGQTGYRAKFDLGHDLVPLFNVFKHRNRAVHALFKAIGTRVCWKSLDSDLAAFLKAHPDYASPLASERSI